MSSTITLPHTALHISRTYSIAISGPWIHVVASSTGQLLDSQRIPSKEGSTSAIRHVAFHESSSHIVTASDDKCLRVWHIDLDAPQKLHLLSSRALPKQASFLTIYPKPTLREVHILVGDKFGDVFRYSLIPPPTSEEMLDASPSEPTSKDPLASHQNLHGTLVLGHTSILTSILLASSTLDNKERTYIITADRDEHIRVSRYPQSYVIEAYCLGSQAFVSALHMTRASIASPGNGEIVINDILISGGGDDVLRLWDWKGGKCLATVEVGNVMRDFLQVRASGEKPLDGNEDGEGPKKRIKTGFQIPEFPLAVQKIDTAELKSNDGDVMTYVVFSGVGASSLFYFQLPVITVNSASTPVSLEVIVQHTPDFGVPILAFSIAPLHRDIFLSLDHTFSSSTLSEEQAVRRLVWTENTDGLVLRGLTESNEGSYLLTTVNKHCKKEAEGPQQNYYELLSILPKYPISEGGSEMMEGDVPGRTGEKKAGRDQLRRALAKKMADTTNQSNMSDGDNDSNNNNKTSS